MTNQRQIMDNLDNQIEETKDADADYCSDSNSESSEERSVQDGKATPPPIITTPPPIITTHNRKEPPACKKDVREVKCCYPDCPGLPDDSKKCSLCNRYYLHDCCHIAFMTERQDIPTFNTLSKEEKCYHCISEEVKAIMSKTSISKHHNKSIFSATTTVSIKEKISTATLPHVRIPSDNDDANNS